MFVPVNLWSQTAKLLGLSADTPFVLLVVALAELIRMLIVRHYVVNEIVVAENPPPEIPIPIPSAVFTFLLGTGLLAAYNVVTCGVRTIRRFSTISRSRFIMRANTRRRSNTPRPRSS